jgi:DNA repair exonuclease SbcCD nuclease subunit
MKILFAADLHVEHSRKSDNDCGERQSLLVLDVLEEQILDTKPDCLVIIGDFFDAFGRLESSIAVEATERMVNLAASGLKIVFIAGNHDYPEVSRRFFGKSMVKALFGHLSDLGIYVVDEQAEFVRLDSGHVILGIPYRETYEQFEETCLRPIQTYIKNGTEKMLEDKIIPCWHVGLPFGTAWRGDENENDWISEDHEAIKRLFSIAYNHQIFCGHYHGPSEEPCGDLGSFIYIGSPSTRSRAESDQDKRTVSWTDGRVASNSTHLHLDKMVSSVEGASEHTQLMVRLFGDEVIPLLRVHINLGESASMDEYNIAKALADQLPGDIRVVRPFVQKKGKGDELIKRFRSDPKYSRDKMEVDMAMLSVNEFYSNKAYEHLSAFQIQSLVDIGSERLLFALGDSVESRQFRKETSATLGLTEVLGEEILTLVLRYSIVKEQMKAIAAVS